MRAIFDFAAIYETSKGQHIFLKFDYSKNIWGPFQKLCLLCYQKNNILWFGLLMYVYVVCIKSSIIYDQLASAFTFCSHKHDKGCSCSFCYHLPDTYKWIFCVVVYFKQVFNIWWTFPMYRWWFFMVWYLKLFYLSIFISTNNTRFPGNN